MAKKLKVGCRYQVKPECYGDFWFSPEDWRGKEKDYIFTVDSINKVDSVVEKDGSVMAFANERKYCKRIKD